MPPKKPAHNITFSPVWIVFFVLVLLGIGGAYYYAMEEEASHNSTIAQITKESKALSAEVAKLQPLYSTQKLEDARQRADLFKKGLLPASQVESFMKGPIAQYWIVNRLDVDDSNAEYMLARYQLLHGPTASVSDWSKIYNDLMLLQKTSGFMLESVEVLTFGDNRTRSFQRIGIRLNVYMKKES